MIPQVQVFQVAALAFAILGFITSFVALLTPSWQIVYAREIQQWIQSGLWLNCQTRPNGMYTCAYSFHQNDFDFYITGDVTLRSPPFYPWQRNLLAAYLIGQFVAFLSFPSFCCSFHYFTQKLSGVFFTIFIGISFLIHAGSSLTFLVYTQMVEYRFYHVSVSGIYEKQQGYSYFTELFATGFYLISLGCSIFHLLQMCMTKSSRSNYGVPIAQEFDGSNFYPYEAGHLDPYETQIAMKQLPPVPYYAR